VKGLPRKSSPSLHHDNLAPKNDDLSGKLSFPKAHEHLCDDYPDDSDDFFWGILRGAKKSLDFDFFSERSVKKML